MDRILNDEEVKAAELSVSKYFEIAGVRRLRARDVLGYAKSTGLHKAEIKEARKRLGIASAKEEGDYWWTWPDDTDPGEINRQKSKEWLEHVGERDRKDPGN